MKTLLLLALVGMICTGSALAQDPDPPSTNAPLTKLETFEARSGALLLKATAPIGTLSLRTATLLVKCRETTDVGVGRKEYGLAVTLQRADRDQETTVIDYDELEPLLSALAFISRVDYSVTSLPKFDVTFKTRGQFRVFIYTSNNRPGTLQFALHDGRPGKPWVLLIPSQLAEFKALIEQAKNKLDQLRANQ